jgi:hypothetical protein
VDYHHQSPYDILMFIPYLLQFGLNSVVYALTNKQYKEAYKAYIKHLGVKFGLKKTDFIKNNQSISVIELHELSSHLNGSSIPRTKLNQFCEKVVIDYEYTSESLRVRCRNYNDKQVRLKVNDQKIFQHSDGEEIFNQRSYQTNYLLFVKLHRRHSI